MQRTFVAFLLILCGSDAQDPATGWMAYAVGTVPSGTERITRLEMTWKVGAPPANKDESAFFSPWFGMDPADNLNLIQPVNPWEKGGLFRSGGWNMYTEYFQWSPISNSNSKSHPVESGQHLHGSLIYDKASDSYDLIQEIVETGVKSSQTVKCQKGKKYTLPYVVYEKTWPCKSYPTDGIVTFTDIKVECDGADCTDKITWAAKVKDANCDMKAVINGTREISITWDTSLPSRFDNHTQEELVALNAHGWATKMRSTASPPTCQNDADCPCSYCMNDPSKKPPFHCHGDSPGKGFCCADKDCPGSYCMDDPSKKPPFRCH